jgi:DNA repair exonuclease SbcCD ATPase subunit
MIILHDYSIENIRSFVDRQTIDISNREKLIQIDGENRNTGGSSGSGKSTVLIALDYLFGLSDIPSTVLQSWLTKEDMNVEANLTINGQPTFIKRSKKKGLLLKYGEAEFQGTLAEEKLQELIAIPKNVFKQMIHKKQDEKGFFLNKTAKQMYDFLIDMLELGSYDAKLKKINLDISQFTKEIEKYQQNISGFETHAKSLQDILSLKSPPIPPSVVGLDALKNKHQALTDKLNQASLGKHDAIKNISKETMPEYTPYDNSIISVLEENIKKLRQKDGEFEYALQTMKQEMFGIQTKKALIEEKGKEILEKTQKISELQNSTCYTCKQHYSGSDAKKTLAELLSSVDKAQTELHQLKEDVSKEESVLQHISLMNDNRSKLSKKLDELKSQLFAEQSQAQAHKAKYEEKVKILEMSFKNKELEITSKWDTAIKELQSEIWTVSNEIQKAESENASYQKALETYTKEKQDIEERIDTLLKSLDITRNNLQETEKNLRVAEEAQRLIKTYTIQVFQETLDLIGEVATSMVSSIPNIQNSTIYFEGCKENQNGSIKDEVTPVITINGHNKIPIKAFSGGERTAIELAVDLAVIDIIETKTGKGANFFILDEPFNGLDSICKEACLEVLKQYDTNKKIIIVDHSSELKEMVSDVITIVKEGESSFVA